MSGPRRPSQGNGSNSGSSNGRGPRQRPNAQSPSSRAGSKGYGAKQARSQDSRSRQADGNQKRSEVPGRSESKAGPDRQQRGDSRPAGREVARTSEQKVYDGPPIPDDIDARDLDRGVRQSLSSLPPKLVERVSRHLLAAGELLELAPKRALEHTLAARSRAPRNAFVREAVGEAAYAAGDYSQALSELRAARRMNGSSLYSPVMADCERGLGRPNRALRMDTAELRTELDEAGRAELAIIISGARLDLDQPEAAVQRLGSEPLMSKSREVWVARLRYAYAEALIVAGRVGEGIEWFHRTVAVDGNQDTAAQERLDQLES